MQTFFFFSLHCFFKKSKNRKQKIVDSNIQMAADSGMENIQALIPNVGEWETACAEGGSHNVLLLEEICVWEMWSNTTYTHIERERERGNNLRFIKWNRDKNSSPRVSFIAWALACLPVREPSHLFDFPHTRVMTSRDTSSTYKYCGGSVGGGTSVCIGGICVGVVMDVNSKKWSIVI